MTTSGELEQRVLALEKRNRRVEKDKAWETSTTRRVLIAVFTYLTIALFLHVVVGIEPWGNAIVPTIGFILSTLTLGVFKRIWEKYAKR